MKDGEVVKINTYINPFTETKSYFADMKLNTFEDVKFYFDSCELDIDKPTPTN